jgi:parallel beta-helix repeat protein
LFKHIVLALAGFTLLIGRANATVTFIGSCSYFITQPGQYHLSQNLSCSGDGIVIDSDDVELHFDGHTLDGGGIGLVGVLVRANNASILGAGTVSNFSFGMYVKGTLTARIVNTRIVNMNANMNNIGIWVNLSDGNILISNTAIGNGDGILIGNPSIGSHDNIVRGNQADGNGLGIAVFSGSADNLFQANKAHNNNVDLKDFNPSCSNTWKSNQFGTSNGPCIQ